MNEILELLGPELTPLITNLLLTLGSDNKVVAFTSTVSGEGKTFVAINLSVSTAILNKKVLLVGLDLRVPRLKEYMNLDSKDGITSYLSGFEKNINNLILPSGLHPNLFVLPAGPIPPNPAELLSRNSLDDAIEKLKEEFDYIFIDTAPSAMVTDTLVMNRVADATVYVCRMDFSSKGNIRFANRMMAENKLKNMLLLINEVAEFHHGYGHHQVDAPTGFLSGKGISRHCRKQGQRDQSRQNQIHTSRTSYIAPYAVRVRKSSKGLL